MMTGVFHFMVVSFGSIISGLRVRSRRSAVTQQSWRLDIVRRTLAPRPLLVVGAMLGASAGLSVAAEIADPRFAVLIFSKTAGFRHASIPQGIAAIAALGVEHG